MNHKRTMVGSLPPPLGGIAVYLHRLRQLQPEDDYIDERDLGWLAWLALIIQPNRKIIYHLPHTYRILSLYVCALFTSASYELFIHGHALETNYLAGGRIMRLMIRKAVAKAAVVHVVNTHLQDMVIRRFAVRAENVVISDPFLPPALEDEDAVLQTYPGDVMRFIGGHNPLLIANASAISFHYGIDLYGLDMCVELMECLKKDYPQAGMIIAISDPGHSEYLEQLRQQTQRNGTQAAVYFLTGNKEIWPLIKRADVLIRPTVIDGKGISVQEALFLGSEAVASDVCGRPPGTILFASRNAEDLYNKVLAAIKKSRKLPAAINGE